MNHLPFFVRSLLLLLGVLGASPVWAVAHPVDDRGTWVQNPISQMKWDSISPQKNSAATLSATTTVFVRLDVSSFKGQMVRLYLVFPEIASGPITAKWISRGRLLSGQITSGSRVPIYTGPIESDSLEDTWQMTIQADGRRLTRTEQLTFSFELEVNGS